MTEGDSFPWMLDLSPMRLPLSISTSFISLSPSSSSIIVQPLLKMKKEKIKSDEFFSSKYRSVSLLLSLLLFLLLFYIALILVASFYHNRNVYTTAAALAI